MTLCDTWSRMPKSPIRSRSLCPHCGAPLYYVRAFLSFLTGRRKRVCLSRGCGFEDPRRFRVKSHGYGHDGER
ncbi:MAG TPA: hypothetical protein VJQ06_11450 [Rhizomicrobium sp.]|nr:hypothetical protein [Rhizomicrobium sp.]